MATASKTPRIVVAGDRSRSRHMATASKTPKIVVAADRPR
jgi:hypothetical protein